MTSSLLRTFGITVVGALIGFVLAACNDDPGTVGSEYLPENITFHTYTLRSDEFTVTSGVSTASNSSAEGVTQIVAGKAPDGTVAYGLVAQTTVPGVLDDGINRPITNVTFRMRSAGYLYGDTSSHRISFDLVQLDEVFVSNAKYSDELATKIENAVVLGSVDTTYSDTGYVTITLDRDLAEQYVRGFYRWDTISVNNGIADRRFTTLKSLALRPRAGSSTIASFLGVVAVPDSMKPTLQVTLGDTVGRIYGSVTNWVAKTDQQTGDGRFVVGAGVAIRSLLQFKLDSLPTSSVIHKAELRLHVDESTFRRGTLPTPDVLVAYLAGDTTFTANGYLTSNIAYIPMYRISDSSTADVVYRINEIGQVMTRWLRTAGGSDDFPNKGMIVAFNRPVVGRATEYGTVDRFAFHGTDDPNPALRPSLTVTYSVQSNVQQ